MYALVLLYRSALCTVSHCVVLCRSDHSHHPLGRDCTVSYCVLVIVHIILWDAIVQFRAVS
jgi:hypothetical protein